MGWAVVRLSLWAVWDAGTDACAERTVTSSGGFGAATAICPASIGSLLWSSPGLGDGITGIDLAGTAFLAATLVAPPCDVSNITDAALPAMAKPSTPAAAHRGNRRDLAAAGRSAVST